MKPLEFSIKQPLFVNLLCIFILIAGVIALSSMHRDLFPNVTYDTVMVTTVYDGATAKDMEKLVTIPLEKELKEVDDIDEMTSSSIENFSVIILKIDPDAKNKDKVVTDIQRAVDSADDLPVDLLDDPEVKEIQSKDMPVVEVSLAGEMSEDKLQEHAKVIEEIILDLPEVSAVTRQGWRDREIWIEVKPEILEKYHIAISEIMAALARRNISMPGGKLIRGEKEFLLRTTGEFETVEDIQDVIIRANDTGNWVQVSDLAEVKNGFEEDQQIYHTNGNRAITLTVIKRENADVIDLVNNVRSRMLKYEEDVHGAPEVSIVNDHSYYVKRRLNVLVQNGFLGVVFVMITLLFFLNPRIALVTAIGIPIAFMITFFVMTMLGISINLISLFGLIIVLGMLVDDAIVISENVFRHIENGMDYKKAAIIGTREVWKPVTSTVLTTVAAFTPLLFMTGIMGKFVWSIPVIVIIALMSSLLQALFILPSHLAEIGRIPKTHISDKLHLHRPQAWLAKVTARYVKILTSALKRRYAIIGVVFVFAAIVLVMGYHYIPRVLFPARGIDVFFVRARLPVGTPLDVTEKKLKEIEDLVATISDSELDDFVTNIGVLQDNQNEHLSSRASHLGQVAVYLRPSADRDRETREIVEELREKSKDFRGYVELSFDEVIPGPPVGKPVAVTIRGDDLDRLHEIAEDVQKELQKIKGVQDIRIDVEEGKGEWQIVVDEEAATRAGLQVKDVAAAVRNAFDGGVATKIKKADEEINVRVRFPYEAKYDESTLGEVMIANQKGHLIPLAQVAKFEGKPGITAIKHLDRKRDVTVTANVDQDIITSIGVVDALSKMYKDFSKRWPGYTVKFGGEYEETAKSMDSLFKAFILAVILIFLILASNFKSVVQPLVVMMAIPFGVIGVLIAFGIHGQPLSFLALLGAVGLSGVVVNNSIILVDFINKRRDEGIDRIEAAIEAGRIRLRPVLITTITTVVGLFPVAYGLWGSDPILIPAALALMWGLMFATVLTLIMIPCLYTIMDDIHERLSFLKFWK